MSLLRAPDYNYAIAKRTAEQLRQAEQDRLAERVRETNRKIAAREKRERAAAQAREEARRKRARRLKAIDAEIAARVPKLLGKSKEVWRIACHEAGHVVAAKLLGGWFTTMEIGPSGGIAHINLIHAESRIIAVAAGAAAEGLLTKTKTVMSPSDWHAFREDVEANGWDIRKARTSAESAARKLMRENRQLLKRVAWRAFTLWEQGETIEFENLFTEEAGTSID